MTVLKNFLIISLVCVISFICIITLNNNTYASALTSKSSIESSSKNSFFNNEKYKTTKHSNQIHKKNNYKFRYYSRGIRSLAKRIKIKIMYALNNICHFLQSSIEN